MTVAKRYTSFAGTVDRAYATWHADVLGAELISQLVRPAATYATALTTFDRSLAGVGASWKTKSDVSALIAADNVVIGDLHALSGTTAAQFSSWEQKLLSRRGDRCRGR